MAYTHAASDECAMCLEPLMTKSWCCWGPTTTVTPCRHAFHTRCISEWLESHAFCPFCRDHIGVSTFHPSSFRGLSDHPKYSHHNQVTSTAMVKVVAHRKEYITVLIDSKRTLCFNRLGKGTWKDKIHGQMLPTQDGVAWVGEALVCASRADTLRLHDIIRQ